MWQRLTRLWMRFCLPVTCVYPQEQQKDEVLMPNECCMSRKLAYGWCQTQVTKLWVVLPTELSFGSILDFSNCMLMGMFVTHECMLFYSWWMYFNVDKKMSDLLSLKGFWNQNLVEVAEESCRLTSWISLLCTSTQIKVTTDAFWISVSFFFKYSKLCFNQKLSNKLVFSTNSEISASDSVE